MYAQAPVSTSDVAITMTCSAATGYKIAISYSGLEVPAALSNTYITNGTSNTDNSGTLSTSGSVYNFPSDMIYDTTYTLEFSTAPVGQTCTLSQGGTACAGNVCTGTVSTSDVAITMTCSAATGHKIAVSYSGLEVPAALSNTYITNGTSNTDNSGTLSTSGSVYNFPSDMIYDTTYTLEFSTAPVGQTCTLSQGGTACAGNVCTGTVSTSDVAITMTCSAPPTYTISGIVSESSAIVLNAITLTDGNNNYTTIPALSPAGTSFSFSPGLIEGTLYAISIYNASPEQSCTLEAGGTACAGNVCSGTIGTANITNITLNCPTVVTYTIGGNITNLQYATDLQNAYTINSNNYNDYTGTISAGTGSYQFPTSLIQGTTFTVEFDPQPSSQTCTLTSSTLGVTCTNTGTSSCSGTIATTNVEIDITCQNPPTYTIGGSVYGPESTVVLENTTNSNTVNIAGGATTYAFAAVPSGTYLIGINSQPSGQTCSLSQGSTPCSGNVCSVTVAGSSINNINLTCTGSPSPTATISISGGQSSLIIPVLNGLITGGTSSPGTIVIENTSSSATAYYVTASLASGINWPGVTCTTCGSIAPSGGTCTITCSSSTPYIAENSAIEAIGLNTAGTGYIQAAFSIYEYLVWSINTANSTALVMQIGNSGNTIQFLVHQYCSGSGYQTNTPRTVPFCTNASDGNGAMSSPSIISGVTLGIYTCTGSSPYAGSIVNGLSNGICNTYQLWGFFSGTATPAPTAYAAYPCYGLASDNSGSISTGTWYLPSLCEMVQDSAICTGGNALTNTIDTNLAQLGLGGLVYGAAGYWTSTTSSGSNTAAWAAQFVEGGGSSGTQATQVSTTYHVLCARSFTY